MTNSLAQRLRGILPPIVTPLNEARRYDAADGERLCQYMLECGVHGLFVLGTSGEGPFTPLADRELIVKTAVKAAGGKVPVVVGVLESGTDQTIEQARIAEKAGADAVVVASPYYFPLDQKGILEHFRCIKKAVSVPLLAYDIPQTTHLKMTLDTILTLADEGTIIGIKDSSPDVNNTRRLISKLKDKIRIFTGSEILGDTIVKLGGVGVVPGLANVAPKEFVILWNHLEAGRIAEATAQQERILKIFEVFLKNDGGSSFSYTINVMKQSLHLRGVIKNTYVSRPLDPIDAAGIERTKRIMTELECFAAGH